MLMWLEFFLAYACTCAYAYVLVKTSPKNDEFFNVTCWVFICSLCKVRPFSIPFAIAVLQFLFISLVLMKERF